MSLMLSILMVLSVIKNAGRWAHENSTKYVFTRDSIASFCTKIFAKRLIIRGENWIWKLFRGNFGRNKLTTFLPTFSKEIQWKWFSYFWEIFEIFDFHWVSFDNFSDILSKFPRPKFSRNNFQIQFSPRIINRFAKILVQNEAMLSLMKTYFVEFSCAHRPAIPTRVFNDRQNHQNS